MVQTCTARKGQEGYFLILVGINVNFNVKLQLCEDECRATNLEKLLFFCLYLLFIECFSVFGHIVSALRSQQRLNLYFNSENITFLVNNNNINDNI